MLALPYLFEFWAFEHQLPPEGDWRTWVIMGGRGAGKTRAGAEWVRSMVEGSRPMDMGRARRVAQVFSAHDPESLRGPQFDADWVDELAKWKKAEEAWDMLQFGLRLGDCPRQCVTTTPKNVPVLKAILGNSTTVVTRAPTEANRAYLAASFLEEVRARYAGTRLGRQELDGVLLEDAEGALWTSAMLEDLRLEEAGELDRIVVAVDPPVTGHKGSDECGIVVVGANCQGNPADWRAVVLKDATVSAATPAAWARVAIAMVEEYGADRLVAEVNQGGDMVESVIRQIDPLVPYRSVRAAKGKIARAEPVAALYEQGRVRHLRGLGGLEDQMCRMTTRGYEGKGSPDRVDALVWALHELMIEPAAKWRRPRVRGL